MQHFITLAGQRAADGLVVSSSSVGATRLAQVYREQGFRVEQLAPAADAADEAPDAALVLHRGGDSVLVHAYCRAQAPLASQAVGHLAQALFDAGADSAVLVGRSGFSVGARRAAARLGRIALLDGAALQAMTGGSEADAWDLLATPDALPGTLPRDAGRPGWPMRLAIGMGGLAMAATMAFASVPALRGELLQLLFKPSVSAVVAPPSQADEPWLAPSQSRSGELALKAAAADAAPRMQQAVHETTGELPANFNQALAAPRL
ncbi:restriction endonuclease [Pseudoxanthomonas spadix]|jgi:hypothetical protein|uniref:restriction endonuclease n=1 Tax=Pseudoxanthomonas spadix TaxID=415229 RepID=UPI000EFFDEDA|nr:restriction endonuclease [Pseudoxanthomonas spadix]MBP3973249.1 restriction endonuclease [Pseudoxanthomonas spadix]RMW96501.1 hypothetical protein D9R12_06400 [Pseudoxanthomonas spadix]